MPLTQNHKAAVGAWFVEEIKRRITVRKVAAEKGGEEYKADVDAIAIKAARSIAKKHRLGEIKEAHLDDEYAGSTEKRKWFVKLKTIDGIDVKAPVSEDVLQERQAAVTRRDAARNCCQEVEFLTKRLTNPGIAAFIAYASRLYVGADMPSNAALMKLLDDHLLGLRPAACKL